MTQAVRRRTIILAPRHSFELGVPLSGERYAVGGMRSYLGAKAYLASEGRWDA